MKVDKAKVIDEVWDDARVASFLRRLPPQGAKPSEADFWMLLVAYQAMRPGDFERFLKLFVAEGKNLDAENDRQQSLADYIASHRHAEEFIQALTAAGARPPRVASPTAAR